MALVARAMAATVEHVCCLTSRQDHSLPAFLSTERVELAEYLKSKIRFIVERWEPLLNKPDVDRLTVTTVRLVSE